MYYCYKERCYHCNKANKHISDSHFVRRYCWNHGYRDCAVYRGSGSGSGCYLTTACVETRGLLDNCLELQILRKFRDGYLSATPEGRADIRRYYELAPLLVKRLDGVPEKNEVYQRVYNELILGCIDLIESAQYRQAHQLYRSYTRSLCEQYGISAGD